VSGREPSEFQLAVAGAFLRIMRARRPDVVWSVDENGYSAREPGEVREGIAHPDDPDALSDGPTRAAS
jgi:hypothetical protein